MRNSLPLAICVILGLVACAGPAPEPGSPPGATDTDPTASETDAPSGDTDGEHADTDAPHGDTDAPTADTDSGSADTDVGPADTDVPHDDTDPPANRPPEAVVASISPAAPRSNQALQLSFEVPTDPDGDAVTVSYTWSVTPAPSHNLSTLGAVVPASFTTRGEVWSVTLVASDGQLSSPPTTVSVTIGNTPGTWSNAVVSPSQADRTEPRVCTPVGWSDADGDPAGARYSWRVDGAEVPGATTAVLGTQHLFRGASVRCVLTPDDGFDLGAAITSSANTVANAVPAVSGANLSNTTPVFGEVLELTDVELSDADPEDTPTLDVSWRIGFTEVGSGTPWVVDQPKGTTMSARVRGYDGLAYSPALTRSFTVANAPPVVGPITVVPDAPRTGQAIQAFADVTDADGDATTLRWIYRRDGVVVQDGPIRTLTSGSPRGSVIEITAIASDGEDDSEPRHAAPFSIANTPPTLAGAVIEPAEPTRLDALAVVGIDPFDADGDTVSLDVVWWSDGAVLGTEAALDPGAYQRGDVIHAVVTPRDDEDAGAPVTTPEVTIANSLPRVLSATVTPDPLRPGSVASVEGVVTDDADGDPVTVAVAWSASDGSAADAPTFTVPTQAGALVTVEVSASDAFGQGPPWTHVVPVVNTLPVVLDAWLLPEGPTARDVIRGEAVAADDDGDPVSLSWRFWIDGDLVQDGLGAELLVPTARGQVVSAEVVPHDGFAAGPALGVDPIEVLNAPPQVVSAELSSVRPEIGEVVEVLGLVLEDPDAADVLSVEVSWWAGEQLLSVGPTWQAAGVVGTEMVARVVPSDGVDEGAPFDLDFVLANSPPLVSNVVITPTDARVGEILTVNAAASSASGDALTFRYVWAIDGEVAQDGSADTLPAPPGGSEVVVTVIAIDSFGEGPPASSDPYVVANTPPVLDAVAVTPDPPRRRDALEAVFTNPFDADGHELSFTYEWRATSVIGASGAIVGGDAVLPPGVVTRGQQVWVRVVPNDGFDDGDLVVSPRRVVANSPPEVLDASLSTSSPRKGDSIEVVDVLTEDADGDPVVVSATWWVDGAQVASGLAFVNTGVRGAVVEARVLASDATEPGEELVLTAQVINSAPVLDGLVLSPTPPRNGDVLHITGDTFDADGDPTTVEWAFLVNGDEVQRSATDSYEGPLVRGDVVQVIGVPHDGIEPGLPASTDDVIVVNTPPMLDLLQILPEDPRVTDDLVAVVEGIGDVDGDEVAVLLEWIVAGVVVQTGEVLDAGAAFRGQTVRLRATLDDGFGGETVVETTTAILNTPPTATVHIVPAEPMSADNLDAVWVGEDDDGDEVFGSLQWFVNGQPVSGATTSTLSRNATRRFDEVQVRLVANDGYGGQVTVWSDAVTVRVPDPTPPIAGVVPNEPQAGADPLKCVILDPLEDADGTPYDQSFVWMEDGVVRADVQGDTVPAHVLTPGSRWTCIPTITDYGTPFAGTSYEVEVGEPGIASVGVGDDHTCVLRTDDRVSCFGKDNLGQASPRSGTYRGVAAVGSGGCAIDASGGLHCWGAVASNLPETVGFTAITGAAQHACALRADGSVACWGQGSGGEQSAPFPVANFLAISAGVTHNCGVRLDGRAVCWGRNDHGQRDAPDGHFRQVAAGLHQSCGVRASGDLVCWGLNNSGVPEGLSGYRSVAMGAQRTCATRFGGEVDCWAADPELPGAPPSGLSALRVHLVGDGGCAISLDGELLCWGEDLYGQRSVPDQPLVSLSMGPAYTCGIAEHTGELSCWGPRPDGEEEPEGSFVSVSVGAQHACAVRADDGTVVCWGDGERGQADAPVDGPYTRVETLDDLTCALRADGRPTCWGPPSLVAPAPAGTFTHIAVGTQHVCGRTTTDALHCWSGLPLPEVPDTDLDTDPPGPGDSGLEDTDSAPVVDSDPPVGETISPVLLDVPPRPFNAPQAGYCGDAVADVVAGEFATCALLTCGDTVCWGLEDAIMDREASVGFARVFHTRDHLCGINGSDLLRNHRGEAKCIGPEAFEFTPPFDVPVRVVQLGDLGGCVIEQPSWLPRCWGPTARQPVF